MWVVQLDAIESDVATCRSWLSDEERDRAARFHFEEHRHRFVVSHGVQRALLAQFEQKHPQDIAYTYGLKGKPSMTKTTSGVHFNMSHCGSVAVYAFTSGCEIGVDVERVRPLPGMEDIAERFFARGEVEELMAFPEPERAAAFFTCWTLKEAYIKATGDGLSVPLDSFCVSLRSEHSLQNLEVGADQPETWVLNSLSLLHGHIGALAYPGEPRPILPWAVAPAGSLLADFS
jgi:4'-phosphopantetheinyl transferase